MAKCPSCNASLDWWKVIKMTRSDLLTCKICGSILKLEPDRSLLLMFMWFAVVVGPSLYVFDSSMYEWGTKWVIVVSIIFAPIMVIFRKFQIVEEGSLSTTPEQESDMKKYAIKRRKRKNIAIIMIIIGLGTWLTDAFAFHSTLSEQVTVLFMAIAMFGLLLLVITRCPYCKHLTFINFGESSGRCMNCHREIDVD